MFVVVSTFLCKAGREYNKYRKVGFVNKKSRVNDWLKVNRLQLPLPNSQSNSATDSIPDSDEKVNRKSKNATDRAADIADHDGSASVEKQHISQPTNAETLIRTPEARSSMDTVSTDIVTDPAEKVNIFSNFLMSTMRISVVCD